MTHEPRRKIDFFTGFLTLACVALAVLVVLLARQNRDLKHQISELASRPPVAEAMEVGDAFGEMVLVDDGGEELPLDFDGEASPTILLVFSTQCPACQETMPIWNDLLAETAGSGPRVLAVQLDEADDTPAVVAPFPVYGLAREKSEAMERIPYIPATLVIDGEGTVEKVWFGVLEDDARKTLAGLVRPKA